MKGCAFIRLIVQTLHVSLAKHRSFLLRIVASGFGTIHFTSARANKLGQQQSSNNVDRSQWNIWWLLFVRAWSLLVVRSIDCCSCPEPSCLSVECLSFIEAWVITALWPKCSCCLVFSYVLCIVCAGCFCRTTIVKLSSLKPSKYTCWILASIGRLVT